MNRRVFLLSSAGALLLANSAFAAASHEEGVARALIGQGYRITSRRRTLLGRIRFTAEKGRTEREVVLDPSSGEILRDYSSVDGGADRPARPGGGDGGGGTAASGGGDSAGEGDGASGDGGSAAGGEPSGGDGESPGGDGEPSGDGENAGGGEKEATGEKESTGGVKEAGGGETTGGRKEKSDARR